jgi:hypothetical protein
MSSKGIWLTVLMRSAHFNSLTHFDEAQQPLLLHIPCYKSGGAFRGLIWSSEVYAERGISKNLSQFPAPLAYNVLRLCAVADLKNKS